MSLVVWQALLVEMCNRRAFLSLWPMAGIPSVFPAPDVDPDPEWLARWRSAVRRPVWESNDRVVRRVVEAICSGQRLRVRYLGGSMPGDEREISPALVFRADGFTRTYIAAHCHTRDAARIFRVERLLIR
jgi:predicted DNA-binding transcriptional regulator YafY